MLYAVAERFAAPARERGRAVSVEEGPRLPLEADRTRLEQALGNLVANALAYGLGWVGSRCGPTTVAPSSCHRPGRRLHSGFHSARIRPVQPRRRGTERGRKRAGPCDRGADRPRARWHRRTGEPRRARRRRLDPAAAGPRGTGWRRLTGWLTPVQSAFHLDLIRHATLGGEHDRESRPHNRTGGGRATSGSPGFVA